MAFEVVKNIVEAEKEVDVIKSKALEKANQIRLDAVKQAEQMLLDVNQNAKAVQEKRIAEAISDSNEEVEKIIAEAARECEAIKDASETKKEAAIKAVIGKVVGINGDS